MENRIDMKSLVKLAFSLLAGMCMIASCNDSDDENISGFTLDVQELTLGAEGGTETVKVASGTKWVAKVDKPWVKVMPANGVGATECKIVVDSTLANDIRNAVVTFVPEGQAKQEVQVHQIGFGKMIGLNKEEVSVVNMGKYGERHFEISVTTNVDFNVNIPAEARAWIKSDKTPVSLDAGARPRTTKVRFDWNMNTDPLVREAMITFTPVNSEDHLEKEAVLKVTQDAAPTIEDNRSGDSIAILLTGEKMNALVVWDTSEKMDYWDGVTLWEKTDDVPAEWVGRLRSVGFAMLSTKEELPSELSHLKYLETLSISGNGNKMLLPDNFFMGDALTNLQHLKHLRVSGYGLTDLRPSLELKEPMKTLESVDFSSNHFSTIPYQLNSDNFPNLTSINLIGMRRHDYNLNLSDDVWQANWGMRVDVSTLTNLFTWEKLKELRLSYNYIYGQFPKEIYGVPNYTDTDIAANDTLNSASLANKEKLKTIQRVMPNMEIFSINLNFLTGDVPDWLFYHPRFANFIPFTFIYTQDNGYDPDGIVPRINNEPANLDEFYEFYPAAKPQKTE